MVLETTHGAFGIMTLIGNNYIYNRRYMPLDPHKAESLRASYAARHGAYGERTIDKEGTNTTNWNEILKLAIKLLKLEHLVHDDEQSDANTHFQASEQHGRSR
jgi:hypothetical protein